jgi:glycosyltransferase involved in cell wall biosynthesis
MDNRKIKIGIDIRDLKIAKTGAHTYLSELCHQINKQESSLFEYVFLDFNWPTYAGPHTIGKFYEQCVFQIWKQIILPIKAWKNGCKIVFCTDYFVPYIQLGYTTIPVFHDAFFWESPSHYNKYWLFLFNKLGISAAKKASKIVTVTSYAQQQIATYSGIDISNIIPIHIAPKSSITHSNKVATNTQVSWEPLLQKKYILHVGTIEKRKNLSTLVKAFEQHILKTKEDIYLIIVGQKSNKPALQDQAVFELVNQSSLLHERVIFTGYLPDYQTAQLYQNATLYVFPSFNEGFGIPILEAFAHKIPVLVANNSCLPEVAGDGAIGFDPYNEKALGDLITQTLSNPLLMKTLQENGSAQLAKFSWGKTLEALEAVFQSSIHY